MVFILFSLKWSSEDEHRRSYVIFRRQVCRPYVGSDLFRSFELGLRLVCNYPSLLVPQLYKGPIQATKNIPVFWSHICSDIFVFK